MIDGTLKTRLEPALGSAVVEAGALPVGFGLTGLTSRSPMGGGWR